MNIEIKNLSKQYIGCKEKALNQVDLVIKPGIFGLVGENGAGKTTLLNILCTKLRQSSGEVHMDNYLLPRDEAEIRHHLGYLPQNFDFFDRLSVNEAMNYIADLKDVSRIGRKEKIEELLDAVHLLDKKSTLIRKLSGGMKQRLGIAQSLLGNSDLIIMDEPTVGLDPTERLNFRNLLTRYAFNKTIIISSHIISDISTMCSNMAVMKHGHILYAGSTQAFIHTMDNKIFSIEVESESSIPQEIEDNVITIIQKETAIEVRYFINDINICKNSIMSLPTLEDAYFYLIKSIGGNL